MTLVRRLKNVSKRRRDALSLRLASQLQRSQRPGRIRIDSSPRRDLAVENAAMETTRIRALSCADAESTDEARSCVWVTAKDN